MADSGGQEQKNVGQRPHFRCRSGSRPRKPKVHDHRPRDASADNGRPRRHKEVDLFTGWRGRGGAGRGNHAGRGRGDDTMLKIYDRGEAARQNLGGARPGNARGRGQQWARQTNVGNGSPLNKQQPRGPRERKFPIGYEQLFELSKEDASSILHAIVSERIGFPNLLNVSTIKPDTLELAVFVMVEACKCRSSPQHVIKLLNNLITSTFLSKHVTSHISKLSAANMNSGFIRNLLALFRELLSRLPTASRQEVLIPLAILQHVTTSIRDKTVMKDEEEKLDSLCDEMNNVKELMEEQEKETQAPKKKTPVEEGTPADDFRDMSVSPTLEDIHFRGRVFLRQNRVSGVYEDLDHYLDVQFRLLREDFMQPLREGIQEYMAVVNEAGRRRFQDIRVYTNVHIIEPVFPRGGITFRIRMDVSQMGNIKWERSKRLIYGSMVCLSTDGFETVLFATVQDRDLAKLKKGELEVRILGEDSLPETSPTEAYVMVETNAYFEAYIHILTGLQKVLPDDFAFQRYIVNCETETNPPAYINGSYRLTYDLSCLCANKNVTHGAMQVPIMQLQRWPTTKMLGLDQSQLRAVQAALTREFAVIQGPPGTGKTYIGLKVVETLLQNQQVWTDTALREQQRRPPIVIVCFTNHALDQFLEGIHAFHPKGIVRVGGRSQSELIQSLSLEKQRKRLSENRELPRHFGSLRAEAYTDMELHRAHIEDGASRIAISYSTLIRVNVLEPFMDENHFAQLREYNIGTMWLELDSPQIQDQLEPYGVNGAAQPEVDAEIDDGEIDVEDEAMLDENLRMPDEEDDEDQRAKDRHTADLRRRMIKLRVKRELTEDENVFDQVQLINNDGYETQKQEKKKRRQRVKRLMKQTDEMSDNEAMRVVHVWNLPLSQRWRLYRRWVAAYRRDIRDDLSKRAREYQNAANRLKEVNGQVDLLLMKQATVLGLTTSGAARNRALLQELQAKIIIVEEAAEVLESHIVTTLNGKCQHLILIGDHQQLRPKPNVYKLAQQYNLNISLFERMVNNGVPVETLECQHRMRPEISQLLRHIYPRLLDDPCVSEYGHVKGVSTDMFFVQHNHTEEHDNEMKSHRNEHEAGFIARLCRYLLMQGHKAESITVLTTYSGQLFELRRQMPKNHFAGVHVCVVDNYQGEENDIILLSLVRSNDDNKMGFLTEDNRVCVALSRARVGFYVIGNFQMFARKSLLWAKLLRSLKRTGAIGEKLGLYCQNHTDKKLQVSAGADFDEAPEGGCTRPCETRLSCGHVCELVCHVYDTNHEKYKCKKPCTKTVCELGHMCRRLCHQDCGNCVTLMDKVIPYCRHTQKVPCSKDPATVNCLAPCEHVLECGHRCANACGEDHTIRCRQLVRHKFPCGHTAPVQCSDRSTCPVMCKATLVCGHRCAGRCSDCHQGRMHVPCRENCDRTLVCGHACVEPCSSNCPPCQKVCRSRCTHSRCPQKCGVPCQPCMEPCPWTCPHYTCTRRCHEQCNRSRCNHHCLKLLKCRHPCIGMCGEPCPDKCRVCHREEVCEVFFGTEDEPDARFVQLEDCDHILEVTSLDTWMDQAENTTDEAVNIQLKRCPKCKTPIQRSLRYGAIVNKTLLDINAVKRRVIGDEDAIKQTKQRALASLETRRHNIRLEWDRKYIGKVDDIVERLHEPSLGFEEATCIENVAKLLSVARDLEKKAVDVRGEPVTDQIMELKQWAVEPRRRFSEQEEADMTIETRRLSLAVSAAKLNKKTPGREIGSNLKDEFDKVVARLNGGQPISEHDLQTYDSTLNRVHKLLGAVGPLSNTERMEVVKAMALSQGHWFKCPNGHIYAIGDCGGATVEGKCPECNATIGGTNHNLRSDNRLASEMDGARHAAWSEQANLENYLDLVNL